jgi:hypothetical protein
MQSHNTAYSEIRATDQSHPHPSLSDAVGLCPALPWSHLPRRGAHFSGVIFFGVRMIKFSRVNLSSYVLDLNPKIIFMALETICVALETICMALETEFEH